MAKTLIDIDEEALAAAMAEYGTTTKVETVNRALREVATRRREATDRFMNVAVQVSEQLAECDVRAVGLAVIVYLTHKSAWEQLKYSDPARERFAKLDAARQLAVCTVVAAELLYSARNQREFLRQRADYDALRWLDISPEAERRALDVMQALAMRGQHRSVGIPDLLIAASAEVHGATVLHYDSDFERIAEVTGQPHEWIVPRGEGHGRGSD